MLQMCLQTGNYLNQGTFRGQAMAVDVGFLSQVRSGSPNTVLKPLLLIRQLCFLHCSLEACGVQTAHRVHAPSWNSSVQNCSKRVLILFQK